MDGSQASDFLVGSAELTLQGHTTWKRNVLDSGATLLLMTNDDVTPGPKASQGVSLLAQNPRTLKSRGTAKRLSPRSQFHDGRH